MTSSAAPPRRRASARAADTVERLVASAEYQIRAGVEDLSVRSVARGAGVAPATAYTYFSSLDHLVAEVFWRRLDRLSTTPIDRRRGPGHRAGAALADIGRLVADDPGLAAACTSALLGTDPDTARVRDRIGAAIHLRLSDALGDDATPTTLLALELAYAGAMLQASMGYLDYHEWSDRLVEVALQICGQ